jgi:NAD(P)-dependent dehydrogenase (short-subunit alcohol dehydrogenase family)
MGAYAASKSAVIRLTESMAAGAARENITVNCVRTIIDTPENRAAIPRRPAPMDRRRITAGTIVFRLGWRAGDAWRRRAGHGAKLTSG